MSSGIESVPVRHRERRSGNIRSRYLTFKTCNLVQIEPFSESTPTICGGYGNYSGNSDETSLDVCHRYDYATDTWSVSGFMPTAMDTEAWDEHPDWGLVMSGGFSNNDQLDDVLATNDGSSFEELAPLPGLFNGAREGHCLVIVDENTMLIAGGYPDSERAFMFDRITG